MFPMLSQQLQRVCAACKSRRPEKTLEDIILELSTHDVIGLIQGDTLENYWSSKASAFSTLQVVFDALQEDGLFYGVVRNGRTYKHTNPSAFGKGIFGSTLVKVCCEIGFQCIWMEKIQGHILFVFRKKWSEKLFSDAPSSRASLGSCDGDADASRHM